MKLFRRSLILVAMALSLGACGVRGGLQAPPEDVATNRSETPAAPKPHKPFVLDGLIR